jgi:hypothetical protein
MNPIPRYARPTIGSINATTIIKYRMGLIRQTAYRLKILFVILEPELCGGIITNLYMALCSIARPYF